MREIGSIQDLYASIDELIAELNSVKISSLANILSIRLHQIAWTTGAELLEELQAVLGEALRTDAARLPPSIKQEIEDILRRIARLIAFTRSSSKRHAPEVGAHLPRRSVLVERKKRH
jgi:hypothetical protein